MMKFSEGKKLLVVLGIMVTLMFFDFWVHSEGQYPSEWWWIPWMITLFVSNMVAGITLVVRFFTWVNDYV